MTVFENEATLSEKRRPGTGSSPKTVGSQSVNNFNFKIKINDIYFYSVFAITIGPYVPM